MVAAMEMKKETTKSAVEAADAVQSFADNIWKELNERVELTGNAATMRSAELAAAIVNLQHKAFDATFDVVARVQERGEKMLEEQVDDARWLPGEWKSIIKEWGQALNDGRAEFQKVVDKSYDLVRQYFKRIERERHAWARRKMAAREDGQEHIMASRRPSASATRRPAMQKKTAVQKTVGRKKPASKK
jgi:hypothetical protein